MMTYAGVCRALAFGTSRCTPPCSSLLPPTLCADILWLLLFLLLFFLILPITLISHNHLQSPLRQSLLQARVSDYTVTPNKTIFARPTELIAIMNTVSETPQPPPHTTAKPQILPCRYKTGKTLGAGSYSVVKECVHIDTGRYYASKVINKRLMAGREHMVSLGFFTAYYINYRTNSALDGCRDMERGITKADYPVPLLETGTERNSCLKKSLYGASEYPHVGRLLRNHEQLYVRYMLPPIERWSLLRMST